MAFEEEFDKLSRGEQAQFRKTLSGLLFHCYLVRRSYDRATKINKISPDYLFAEKYYDLFASYLSFAGIEISKDDENGVIFLTSGDDYNRIRIDGVTTLIIYALRSYYEEKLAANPSLNEIFLDSIGLKLLLKDLGLTTASRRISAVTVSSALRTLVMYSVITMAKGSLSEGSYAFYILPSIRYVISNARLNVLYEALKEDGGLAAGSEDMSAPDDGNQADGAGDAEDESGNEGEGL